jgi:tRNA U34 5-carboxymethylaminomethyl modifying GTPase MnmE/TrmE
VLEEVEKLNGADFDRETLMVKTNWVVGKTTTEDLLDSIFSQFCIGK